MGYLYNGSEGTSLLSTPQRIMDNGQQKMNGKYKNNGGNNNNNTTAFVKAH